MALRSDTITADQLVGHCPRVRDRKLSRSSWIDDWDPEDLRKWELGGERTARRNLIFSILSEHIGFSIWSLWSVFVLFMGKDYGLSPADKFLLTSTPAAVCAALRLPYAAALARFGGRTWTIVSALLLFIPTIYIAVILEPGASLTQLLIGAALAGLGGSNFSASMANIDAFYPQRLKGWALGLNAGGANLGVAAVQLTGLAVLTLAGRDHARVMLMVYMPLVAISALCASRYMDNLRPAHTDKRVLRDVVRQRHTWLIAVLYIGSFGSFIGFSFAFGQVLQVQFDEVFDNPLKAAYLTFLGPLLGSVSRPIGGRLADRHGGAHVTAAAFAAMILGTGSIVAASATSTLWLFLVSFVSLFVLTGIANGSIYKMIPTGFRFQAQTGLEHGLDPAAAELVAKRRTRALIAVTGAIGALGGVLVNLVLRQSFLSTGTGTQAFVAFIGFYAACLIITLTVYLRPTQTRMEVTR